MFKFIHTADIHLDSPLLNLERYEGAPVEAIRSATRRAFENLVVLAVSESVDFILISGDLYDGDWKDYNTGLYFVSQMAKLREAGIQVFIIAGNHDAAGRMTKTLRLPDNVYMFPVDSPSTVQLEKIQTAIHGQGFATPAVKRNLAVNYPLPVPGFYNIGMLHTGVSGREHHEPYAPCTVQDLVFKGYDYWALGHIHQKEFLSSDPLVVFPGNLQGRHIRETGQKGCMLVSVGADGAADAQFRSVDVMRWEEVQVDITGLKDGYDVVDRAGDELSKAIEKHEGLPVAGRVVITGESGAHEVLAADPGHWVQQIRSLTLELDGHLWIEKVKIHSRNTLENFRKTGGEGPVEEIFDYIDELLKDADMLAAFTRNFEDLERKLPKDLMSAGDIDFLYDHDWIPSRLQEVRSLLLNRLMAGKGDS